MTHTPYRHNQQNEHLESKRSQGDYPRSQGMRSQNTPLENTVTIVPVQRENQTIQESQPGKGRLGLKRQASASAKELGNLRNNINFMADQLQRLLEKEGAAAEQAQLLNEITSKIRESLNTTDIFNATVQNAREALQTDRVIIYRFNSNNPGIGNIVAESVDTNWPITLGAKIADPNFSHVDLYQKGQVWAIGDIYLEDAPISDSEISHLETLRVKAKLVAPILVNQKLNGLLIAHQCSGPRNWIESEIEFFRQLAVQVGYALDQSLLLEQQSALAKQAQALNEISLSIRQSLNQQDIFASAVEETRDALGADRVIVYLLDADWNGIVFAESVDRKWPVALGSKITDPCFGSHHIKAYLRGRVKVINNSFDEAENVVSDPETTQCYLNQLKPFAIKAILVAPIIVDKNLYGLLIAHQCDAPRVWKELEIDLIRQVAIQLGYALEQAFAIEQQQTAAKQARILNEITSRMRESLKVEDIFDTVVDDVRESMKTDRVIIYQFDPSGEGTVVAESVDPKWASALEQKFSDPGFTGRYLKQYQRGRLNAINNIYEASLSEEHINELKPYGVKANLIAPIIAEKKLHGLLVLHQCSGSRTWKESELDFIRQLATQIGFALDQVSLLESQKAAIQQARRLNEIALIIRESLNPQDVFNTSVVQAREVLKADRVVVYQVDKYYNGILVAESVDGKWSTMMGAKLDVKCFREHNVKAYLRGRVKVINNIADEEEAYIDDQKTTKCFIDEAKESEIKAAVVTPIIVEKKLRGFLIAHQCSQIRNWQESEIDFLKQLGTQIGFALEQGNLLEQQQSATEQARRLNDIALLIRETQSAQELCNTCVTQAREVLKADRVMVYQLDGDYNGTVIAESVDRKWPTALGNKMDGTCFSDHHLKPYFRGRVKVLNNLYDPDETIIDDLETTECYLGDAKPLAIQATVVAPIIVQKKLYGFLIANQCSAPRNWQESEVDFLKQLAVQVGF
ncbi:MAG: GAF domain-containing protein, partial [Moorea sp. SIO2B7]|nr:GAF domain-containing protein [Moorena sp. SIO2B7]